MNKKELLEACKKLEGTYLTSLVFEIKDMKETKQTIDKFVEEYPKYKNYVFTFMRGSKLYLDIIKDDSFIQ